MTVYTCRKCWPDSGRRCVLEMPRARIAPSDLACPVRPGTMVAADWIEVPEDK